MSKIYKYELHPGCDFSEDLPFGSNVVHVGFQTTPYSGECLFAWIELPDTEELHTMTLRVVGTGHVFDSTGFIHVGSAVGDPYVWHVYEKV